MDIDTAPETTVAMASSARQLQETVPVQIELMKEIAEQQQRTVQMLNQAGLGFNIDIIV